MTRHISAQDELQEGFEPSPFPPMAPDGALEIPPLRAVSDPPPRLCEAGPCRHYHRMVLQLDAQRPIANAIEPGGKLVGIAPEQPFHVNVHHYCYPDTGIETELGSLPVLECNRWEPFSDHEILASTNRKNDFLASARGKEFQTALDTWRQKQRELAVDLDAIGDADMPALPDPTPDTEGAP